MSTTTTKNFFADFVDHPGEKKLETVPREVNIRKGGSAIVVPANLTYGAAANALYERAKMEEEPIERVMKYACHPNDGYVALTRLIEEMFGFVLARPVPGLFGPKLPQIQRIRTGLEVTDFVEALSDGIIGIPTIPDIKLRVGGDTEELLFYVQVTAKEKHRDAVNAFLNELETRIRRESIYRGKAFDSQFNFLDLRSANETQVILPQATEKQVRANLWAPLAYRERLKEIGTPFGRSVLLEGPYGTGKTLLAFIAGHIATANGITFIYVHPNDADKLPMYLRYARLYAPAVLFYEDIDMLAGGADADRADNVQLVLNTLDGIDAKSGAAEDVMVVMTTNNVQVINEALMRPGRIDAVIHVGLPDAEAAARLVVQYGNGTLSDTFDANEAGAACANMTPAFIREIVERSKLVALSRDPHAPHVTIQSQDVVVAAQEIADHLALAQPRDIHHTTGDRMTGVLREIADEAMERITNLVVTSTEQAAYGNFNREQLFEAAGEGPVPLPLVTNGVTA